jgi:hypothetical protein
VFDLHAICAGIRGNEGEEQARRLRAWAEGVEGYAHIGEESGDHGEDVYSESEGALRCAAGAYLQVPCGENTGIEGLITRRGWMSLSLTLSAQVAKAPQLFGRRALRKWPSVDAPAVRSS